jgi:hypothetical protein
MRLIGRVYRRIRERQLTTEQGRVEEYADSLTPTIRIGDRGVHRLAIRPP